MEIPRTVVQEWSISRDSVTVIPGPEYDAGGVHRFFFGDHYRDLWTMPARVPVLDLHSVSGGLTPTEAGGGFQTKSLRFEAGDGRFFKFRSANKNPRAVLPLELRETIAADLAQDHISTSHPAGAVVVDRLARAVGVPFLGATLVYLPDDERLGKFRADFGGLLGVIELYPKEVPDRAKYRTTEALRADKFRNTMKMFEAMDEDSEDRPAALEFLKARFLDIFVGDWDRHVKQWKWAQFSINGKKTWYAIPMDRDQAMVRLDGLFPSAAAMSITQFTDFNAGDPDIYKLTFSGRFLDRRLLSGVSRSEWDSTASAFIAALSDESIEDAVRHMPAEYDVIDGERIVTILKSRRDAFRRTSTEFYELLASYVDIHLSDKREYAEIVRNDDRFVSVTAWRRSKETGEKQTDRLVFHRVFDRNETEEIRLYALGGDDRVVVSGNVSSSITVRVIGGKGDDDLVDRSHVAGILWGFVPFIASDETLTFFYDHQGSNTFGVAPRTSVDEEKYEDPPGGIFQY